jgi:uncharacterized protein
MLRTYLLAAALGVGLLLTPMVGPLAGGRPSAVGAMDGPQDQPLVTVEIATVGMDRAQNSPVVLLRDGASGRIVPIWVGVSEAHAILLVMLGIETQRPMTHDLLTSVIAELGATVEEVWVHEIRETTYIGRIRLRVGDEPDLRDIDSRPSDALAVAIRTDAPVRVAADLLADPPPFDFLAPEADAQVVRMLGITVVAPSDVLRARYRLPDRPGLVVVGVSGEAAEQGLRRGDLIVDMDGAVPLEPMDFLEAVRAARDTLRIRYWRDGEESEIRLAPVEVLGPQRPRTPPPIQT